MKELNMKERSVFTAWCAWLWEARRHHQSQRFDLRVSSGRAVLSQTGKCV